MAFVRVLCVVLAAVLAVSGAGKHCGPSQAVREAWDPHPNLKIVCETRPGPFSDPTLTQCCCSIPDASNAAIDDPTAAAVVNVDAHMRCLPHVVVVGAQKSGTTALFGHLSTHPAFHVSSHKELHFFDRLQRHDRGLDSYIKSFEPYSPHHISGEATPSYMLSIRGMRTLAQTVPDVRLVAILRDPVTRLYSEYNMKRRRVMSLMNLKRDKVLVVTAASTCVRRVPQASIRLRVQCMRSELAATLPGFTFQIRKGNKNFKKLNKCLQDSEDEYPTLRGGSGHRRAAGALHAQWLRCLRPNVIRYESVRPLDVMVEEEMQKVAECTTFAPEPVSLHNGSVAQGSMLRWGTKACWPQGSDSNIAKDFVLRGVYYPQIVHLYSLLPHDQILVLQDKELSTHPRETMDRVWRFLGMPVHDSSSMSEDDLHERINKLYPSFEKDTGWSMQGHYEPMPDAIKDRLYAFYKPYNQQLARLLGPKFLFPQPPPKTKV